MLSDDGNQFIANKGEVAADIKVEEDPWPATYTGIKTEPAVSFMYVCESKCMCIGLICTNCM
jgi:hypothetical protein